MAGDALRGHPVWPLITPRCLREPVFVTSLFCHCIPRDQQRLRDVTSLAAALENIVYKRRINVLRQSMSVFFIRI